jgi:hypothetical protein
MHLKNGWHKVRAVVALTPDKITGLLLADLVVRKYKHINGIAVERLGLWFSASSLISKHRYFKKTRLMLSRRHKVCTNEDYFPISIEIIKPNSPL